jgi:hypothetical protein
MSKEFELMIPQFQDQLTKTYRLEHILKLKFLSLFEFKVISYRPVKI